MTLNYLNQMRTRPIYALLEVAVFDPNSHTSVPAVEPVHLLVGAVDMHQPATPSAADANPTLSV
jgi:hypothetical protein